MAPQVSDPLLLSFRAATYRLSSTPPKQLPQVVPYITNTLTTCKGLLSSPASGSGKDASETGVLIHKFKTKLSSLLQDRTVEGRWAAIVLVKCAIEVGGWEMLSQSAGWVRGLLEILSKSDPSTTKKICIITLTRTFMATRDYPTLVREITTPSLPPFITSCLNNVAPGFSNASGLSVAVQGPLLPAVLESFTYLLPRHPTIFRSFQNQIMGILVKIVAPTPSSEAETEGVPSENQTVPRGARLTAQRLFVQLHFCALKTGPSEEWDKTLQKLLSNIHGTADKIFRAVIEDWQSTTGAISGSTNGQTLEHQLRTTGPDPMGLPGWSGIHAGSERMIGVLEILEQFICISTHSSVVTRVGAIMDVLIRIFSLTVPSASATSNWQSSVRINNQVGKEEREGLWSVLPDIHIAAIAVLLALFERYGNALMPVFYGSLDQMLWVFEAEKSVPALRSAVYSAIAKIIRHVGPSMSKASVSSLAPVIRASCVDLLVPVDPVAARTEAVNGTSRPGHNKSGSTNIDTFFSPSTGSKSAQPALAGLHAAAHELLPILYTKLPAQHVSHPLRSRMDRTAILTQHKEAMLASVLNPPPKKSSIMPILARLYPDSIAVEGVLRPRMPAIRVEPRDDDEADGGDEDDLEKSEQAQATFPGGLVEETPKDMNVDSATELEGIPEAANEGGPADQTQTTSARSNNEGSSGDASAHADNSLSTTVPPKKHAHDIQEESMPIAKRPRLEDDEASPRPQDTAMVLTPVAIDDAGVRQEPPQLATMPAQAMHSTSVGNQGNDDSDDDDFEIPALVIDPDSDEENDDEA